MARKGKLLAIRDREAGRNIRLEKQRQQEKAARKRKRTLGEQLAAVATGEDNEEGGVAVSAGEKTVDDVGKEDWEDEDEDTDEDDEYDEGEAADEDDEDGGIPFSDLDSVASDDKADVIPYQRLTINNTAALSASLRHLALPDILPFSAHQRITAATPTVITDVHDDLGRELAFYKQALDAAIAGRRLLRKDGVPFTRPTDYFAEMVKSDEHMGKIRDKLTAKEQDRKASAEAKRQRDLKRFGKQVQVQKLQERDRQKRELKEKVNVLKRSMFLSFLCRLDSFPPSRHLLHPHLTSQTNNRRTHHQQRRSHHPRRRPL